MPGFIEMLRFREVDKDGKVALGSNFMTQMGLEPNSIVGLKVMHITGSVRYPYLFVHSPENEPRFSALETAIHQCLCRIDEQGSIVLRWSLSRDLVVTAHCQPPTIFFGDYNGQRK